MQTQEDSDSSETESGGDDTAVDVEGCLNRQPEAIRAAFHAAAAVLSDWTWVSPMESSIGETEAVHEWTKIVHPLAQRVVDHAVRDDPSLVEVDSAAQRLWRVTTDDVVAGASGRISGTSTESNSSCSNSLAGAVIQCVWGVLLRAMKPKLAATALEALRLLSVQEQTTVVDCLTLTNSCEVAVDAAIDAVIEDLCDRIGSTDLERAVPDARTLDVLRNTLKIYNSEDFVHFDANLLVEVLSDEGITGISAADVQCWQAQCKAK